LTRREEIFFSPNKVKIENIGFFKENFPDPVKVATCLDVTQATNILPDPKIFGLNPSLRQITNKIAIA